MLTQKAISAIIPEGELSKNVVNWVAKNSSLLEAKFDAKYPRSKNKFNAQIKNADGRTRTIVINETGEVKYDKESKYKNVITWQHVRRLGCPVA